MSSLKLKLVQKAKAKGGDKYVCETDEKFTVYIQQKITRKDGGEPLENLTMVIETVEKEDSLVFGLVQKAKAKGGDKYACEDDEKFTVYIQQTVSRKDGEPFEKLYVNFV